MEYLSKYTNFSAKKNDFIATVKFTRVEETPLMEPYKVRILVSLAIVIICLGFLISGRIYVILSKRKTEAAIDKLFLSNTVLGLICHPLILVYYIGSHLLFPMSDYIGTVGCLLNAQLLDVFVRFYHFCFPASVALLRYLFVVKHLWVKSVGMKTVVNYIIALTLILPLIMTISVQFPISEFIHGPFQFCIGRFETYFNPTHPDPFTPGRRDGERHCVPTERWAFEPNINEVEQALRILLLSSCLITKAIYWIAMLSLPEIILYCITFLHIKVHTNRTELSGILNPETINRRKQKNTLNIIMTFWAWLAQFATNITYIIVLKLFFGKHRFFQALFAEFTVCLNFNILPLFYIALADEDLKSAILKKEYSMAARLFFYF
jgi:hypothetical protein